MLYRATKSLHWQAFNPLNRPISVTSQFLAAALPSAGPYARRYQSPIAHANSLSTPYTPFEVDK